MAEQKIRLIPYSSTNMQIMTLRFSPEEAACLEKIAADKGTTLDELIEKLLNNMLEDLNPVKQNSQNKQPRNRETKQP